MAKIGTLKTDSAKESNGVWVRYRDSDVRVLVARMGNPEFEAAQRRLKREAREGYDGGELTERQARDVVAPAIAEFIVLSWEKLEDNNGKAIPYSRAKCVELLRDPELRDFYDWIVAQSSNRDNFAKRFTEEATKNSVAPSTGT